MLFTLAAGLSMDAFAAAVCKGLTVQKVNIKNMLVSGAWFGGFQALMPFIGYKLGIKFDVFVNNYADWIACILLAVIGINMIAGSDEGGIKNTDEKKAFKPKEMLIIAIATSIDAMAAGVSFAFLKVNVIRAILIIGITTFIFSAAGVKVGSVFGARYKRKAEIAGGVTIILLGAKILAEHYYGGR